MTKRSADAIDVIKRLAKTCTGREIARRLGVNETTVRKWAAANEVDLMNRQQATRAAWSSPATRQNMMAAATDPDMLRRRAASNKAAWARIKAP